MRYRNETPVADREESFPARPRPAIPASAPIPTPEAAGAFLDGWGYRLIGEMAATPHSLTILAEHRLLGARRAVKTASFAGGTDREAFVNEARLQACCPHPCIARAHDARMADRIGGIAMELVNGPTLRELYRGVPCPRPDQTARFVASLASAVDALHGLGVAHCDIKPANVLAEGRTPRLIDFGSAVRFEGGNGPNEFGRMSATPATMAPELLDGSAAPGPATDIYSLGALLYYCLAGRYPHDGRQPAVLLKRKRREMPPKLDLFRPDAVPCLEGIALRALSPFPERRQRTARAFADELLAACDPAAPGEP